MNYRFHVEAEWEYTESIYIYYTAENDFITIWTIMHLSRKPDYWKARLK